MDSILLDARYALRSLVRAPVFAAVTVVTLGLAIGANTAVFSVVNAVLLKPLPYDEPDRLTLIWTEFGPDLPQNWVSGPEYVEMMEYATVFEAIGSIAPGQRALTGTGDPEQLRSAGASGNFFDVLNVRPLHGRLFGPAEDVVGGEPVVVLGHGFWRRRFAGDPSVVGRVVRLDDQPFTVIGVLPSDLVMHHPEAGFPRDIDVWTPLAPAGSAFFGDIGGYAEFPRGSHFIRTFGRLRPGVTMAQAQADMDEVARRIHEKTPSYYHFEGWGIRVVSLHDDLVEDVRPALLVLLGAVAFVLLIACVNVANLLLTRAAAREREIAVRSALGAGRLRMMRQLLTESLVLSGAGGLLGLLLSYAMIRLLSGLAPATLPRADEIAIDGGVLAFTLVVSVATGVLFGLAPGLHAIRQRLVASLKEGGRGATTGRRGRRAQTALVIAEVALALVLLVGAGLMIQSFRALTSTDPGYRPAGVLSARIDLPAGQYDEPARAAFADRLTERVAALPGVISAGVIDSLPLAGLGSSGTAVVERSRTISDPNLLAFEADRRWVTPDYFTTMGVNLIRGRFFTDLDGPDAPPVAIVDEEFARRVWPSEDPVGQRLAIDGTQEQPNWREVVGVVAHARTMDVAAVGREQVYFPFRQGPQTRAFVVARTTGEPASLAGPIRAIVGEIDADRPVSDVMTMQARVDRSLSQPRFNLLLLTSFAVIALVLAAVGLYGVLSYSVSQRNHEIGVRMALGAGAGQVRALVLRQGMTLVGLGLVIGALIALWLTRTLSSLLYDVAPNDPVTYTGVVALLAAVGAAACLVPALRATRVQPVTALHGE